jgi:8-oxo-dGTP pyrophosphatase MutT (NUDIX family)
MPEEASWRVIASRVLLDRPPWLRVIEQQVVLPNGIVIDDYLLAPGRDYAMVIAVTPARDVLLVRQYKHGIGRELLEFPAGYLDASDADALACAKRELLEETGFTSQYWTPLGAFCIDSNRAPTSAHLFLAQDAVPGGAPHLDDTEALTMTTLPLRDVPALLASGGAPSIACAAAWALAMPHLGGSL